MSEQATTRRPLSARLGFQLAFLLAAVLLPLTVISAVNSASAVDEMQASSRAALTGETVRAAAPILQQIQQARGAVSVLALTVRPLLADDAACAKLMRDVKVAHPEYALVALIQLDGQTRCSSFGKPIDFAKYPFFSTLTAVPHAAFSVNSRSPVLGVAVLGISHPVFDDTGNYRGIVYLSLPQSSLDIARSADDKTEPIQLVTFDRTGEILTTTSAPGQVAQTLPLDHPLASLAGPDPVAFSAQSAAGAARVFSVVPLVAGEFFALGTWPALGSGVIDKAFIAKPFLMPALIWLASLIVAWVSVEMLVIRHVRTLSLSLKSFASGNRKVGDINVTGAPLEIREMADAYVRMTEAVVRDEADLENTVHQKEVLLREVHHRVKNNLQLIASIMNMQMRQARSPEVKVLIKGLQDRVMSLATVHRDLYQTTGLTDVNAAELLTSITRQITRLTDEREDRFAVSTDFTEVHLTPDQAVPIALLLAEALNKAMTYAVPFKSTLPQIVVRLTHRADERVTLTVANSCAADTGIKQHGPDQEKGNGQGLGAQLLQTFAMQLGGQVNRSVADGFFTLSLAFARGPLTEAEARHAKPVE